MRIRNFRTTAALSAVALFVFNALAHADTKFSCGWAEAGTEPPLTAKLCGSDKPIKSTKVNGEQYCALMLDACLQPVDFETSSNWWLFTADNGLQQGVANPVHINHQTPQHGLFLSVYVNKIARDALEPLLRQVPTPKTVDLPEGSVIVKVNYNTRAEFADRATTRGDKKRWLTAMAKVEDLCIENVGGTCSGGNWFYYLSRFGGLKSFVDVYGVDPDGLPTTSERENAIGQPSAFCTDCHNPVEKSDFLWTLDAAFWKTHNPEMKVTLPHPNSGTLTPADLCEQDTITFSATPPKDVPVAPSSIPQPALRQAMFDCFSWQSFIALNWPADPGQRGRPETDKSFPSIGVERVWESYRETFEVFKPENENWAPRPESWSDTPDVPKVCQAVIDGLDADTKVSLHVPKALQMVTKTRANQLLNETHQAFGNQFNVLVDQYGELVRYEVRMNQDEFQYLTENGYADTGKYSYSGPTNGEKVFFPTASTAKPNTTQLGAIEIKAAWRNLCPKGDCTGQQPERFYTRTALKYTPPLAKGLKPSCELLDKVGLIGLHVIRKTDTAPQWIWSTFEQVDNVPSADSFPAPDALNENIKYTLYNPKCELIKNKPTEAQCATQRPGVLPFSSQRPKLPSNQANCCANLQLLKNAEPGPLAVALTPTPAKPSSAKKSASLIRNHITRLDPIGPQAMNTAMQKKIRADDPTNPFQFYKLVNTQWPGAARNPETGDMRTLSCFQRDLVGRYQEACYTILPRNGVSDSLRLRNTSMETFQVSNNGVNDPVHFSSSGCLNCHGDAGVDFSFVFTDGAEILTPLKERP